MNADGSGVTRLTDNDAADRSPAWSPDGQRIAFDSDRDGDFDIYVMNAAGEPVATTRPTPEPEGADRICRMGLQLNPGDQCSYEGFSIRIREDGAAVLDGNIGGISMGNTVMNAQSINLNRFSATRSGSTWTIQGLP
ncbi:MAG: hypothetical protein OXP66_06780, partial [Candidatus Tectomicrobia bacterium]|nr:hypothetical protein [Candidatus Tectomicrobia bacterium]